MKIIIFDTETTGFVRANMSLNVQPYIVQFAAILLEYNLEDHTIIELQRLNQLIKPQIKIPPVTSKIHGITDETVKNSPDFLTTYPKIIELFDLSDVAIAHNIDFDQKIIEIELERNALNKKFLPPQIFDTMKIATELCAIPNGRGRFKYPKLDELHHKLFNINVNGAHNAIFDVEATVRVASDLIARGVITPQEPSKISLF